jgi:membrane carboxypeptidase/penicillin-binding protein PbpC
MKPFLASKDANDGCVILIQKNKLVSMNVFQKYGSNGSFINGCLRKRQVGSAMKPFIYAL